jgi:hypothetical protein
MPSGVRIVVPPLPLDAKHNGSENALRRQVVGRKNWPFVGNDDAGEVNTMFVSLLANGSPRRPLSETTFVEWLPLFRDQTSS